MTRGKEEERERERKGGGERSREGRKEEGGGREQQRLKVDLIDHKPFGSQFSKTSTETAFFTVLGGGCTRLCHRGHSNK